MFNKITDCISNNISPLSYINSFQNETVKEQFIEIFKVLIDEKMIKHSHEKEFEIDFKFAEFKITNRCNLNCIHCAVSADINNSEPLATKDAISILDKIFKTKIDNLLITGGEPLIRNDIEHLLLYARKNFKGKISLLTNATLIDKTMANLLKKCVDDISISIDGYDESSTEYIRGKGVFNKIVETIAYLKKLGFEKDSLSLTMTCTSQNINHKEDFNALCKKLGVSPVLRDFTLLGRG